MTLDAAGYPIFALGIVAAVMTTVSWIPQAMRTIRMGSAHDFAWSYLTLFGGGVFLWMLYGIARHDPAVIGANLITFVLLVRIILVKVRGG
jgi:MtN3 and saliva related transmembrane protein